MARKLQKDKEINNNPTKADVIYYVEKGYNASMIASALKTTTQKVIFVCYQHNIDIKN